MSDTLKSKLASGRFVMTAEITPTASSDPADLVERVLPLKGFADAVNVTDGASARAHLDALVAAQILLKHGVEPILQMTCRDKNRIALQSALLGAAASGIGNILVLTGDDPKQGDQPDAKPVFDLDSTGLVATAVRMRDQKELPNGRKISGPIDYILGVADAPVDPKPDWTPKSLLKKIEAGAEFAQTQFCMDADVLRRYMARLKESGVPESFRFLIGRRAAGVGEIGAVDEEEPVRHRHPRRHRDAHGSRLRSQGGRGARSASRPSPSSRRFRASPASTSWPRSTTKPSRA